MKKNLWLLPVIVLAIACKDKEKKPVNPVAPATVDSFLVTDSSWGFIRATTDFESLKKIYGDGNVLDERICGAECLDSVDVTTVFPDKENEITVYWNDTAYHRLVSHVESYKEKPDWHSAEGIRMGSGLKDLLRVNGKKISFYGFGWDYGGTVSAYNGGKLEKSKISYRLNLNAEFAGDNSLYGDIGLDTDMPAVQKAMDKISVWWITLSFYKGEE